MGVLTDTAMHARYSPIVFCLLKKDSFLRLRTTADFEMYQRIVESHGFVVLWRMEPVFLRRSFWEKHYRDTIMRKEAALPGDGSRYRAKVLGNHEDTWVIPCLLLNKRPSEKLARVKRALRKALAAALHLPPSMHSSTLIHMSDDVATTVEEVENFRQHLETPEVLHDLNEEDALLYRDYLRAEVCPFMDTKLFPLLYELERHGETALECAQPLLEQIPPLHGKSVLMPSQSIFHNLSGHHSVCS